MKKKFIVISVLLCALCLFSAAAAAEEAGAKQAVRLPAKLSVIGEDAFAGTAFEAVEVPAAVLSIGPGAFADMPNLTELRFADTVRILSGSGVVRIAGRAEKPEEPARTDGSIETERLPGAADGTRKDPREGGPTGTVEDTGGRDQWTAAPEYGFAGGPRDGAAFHPLRLRFP